MKLAVQLEKPATAMAEGLGPWENNSATMNQGMGPGPISKNATKAKMATMLKYDIHLSWSYKNKGQKLGYEVIFWHLFYVELANYLQEVIILE